MAEKIHIRRCHVCGETIEAAGCLVEKCGHCGKHLATFYYFNEKLAMNLMSRDEAGRQDQSSALPLRVYPPINGLTVYWDG